MNLTHLTAFHAVMTSATLSDAAKRLGRTQPAVSAAIKALEEQLGLGLFLREGRKLVPVPEAQYLFTETEAILNQLARVQRTMRSLVDGQTGSLHVASMLGPAAMLFPRFIASKIAGTPGCRVSMFARSTSEIAELARAQSIDFGFTDDPGDRDGENLYLAEIILGDCFLALPAGHRLAEETHISFADLDGEPMGLLQVNYAHRDEVSALFEARGARLNAVVETQTFQSIMQFVIAGQCCAVLDPLTVVHCRDLGIGKGTMVVRPLAEKLVYRYALLSPRYRPMSVIAMQIRAAWRDEVIRLLDDVSANPEIEGPGQS